MKKAMISQPMRGLSRAAIKEARDRATEKLKGLGFDVVDTLFDVPPRTCNAALGCLAAALKTMAECDLVYFCAGWENTRGCVVEHAAASLYGLDIISERGGK